MKHWRITLAFIVSCTTTAVVGYWFGFREALPLGIWADFLPRGVLAATHLTALRSGNPDAMIPMLEADVDNSLIEGDTLFQHPLRHFLGPLWGLDLLPEYEQFAVRLANYRKMHPPLMKADAFDHVPPEREKYRESYKELALGARERVAKVNAMVEQFSTKK